MTVSPGPRIVPIAAEVCLVAGREDDRVLGPHPLGELPLQLDVQRSRAVQQARAGDAGAVGLQRVAGRPLHPLVAGQAEVVVGAEHDRLASLHLDHRAGLGGEQPEVGEEVVLLGRFQLLEAVVVARLLEDVDRRLRGFAHGRECRFRPVANVSIRPVRTRRELKRFVKVPFRLHRDQPQWVPPLIFERMQFLDRAKNPCFEHGEAEYFLAERDGEPVGRITAQIDRSWDETQGGSDAMFGFFETVDDREVAAALLEAASEWARGKGRERILGPMDFTTNDEIGLLIEGYERRPMILENWHPPFYKELIEAEGFAKAMDLLMWELQFGDLKEGESFDPSIHAAAEKALRDEGVAIRNISLRNLRRDAALHARSTTRPGATTGASSRSTDAEIEFHAKLLKQVLDEDWAFIAERDGEPIGAALTLPDVNQALAKLNGRLLPFGWAVPARQAQDRPAAGLRARRQARLPAHRRRRRPVPQASGDGGESGRDRRRRDGLDPRDQRGDEPGDGGHGRQGRQALPDLREGAERLMCIDPGRSAAICARCGVPRVLRRGHR